ncbi:MAG: hypothetical protein MJ186_04570 [Clostridia bacterium]|nr:hypothetical protein [Clostridia bacterium]
MGIEVKRVRKNLENVERFQTDVEPFKAIDDAFKEITGGKTLSQLMEEGRVYNAYGEPIGVAGLSNEIDFTVTTGFKDACDAMKKNGIMILDEKAGNRPRHVYFEEAEDNKLNLYASEPISKDELSGYYSIFSVSAKQKLEAPVKPGFLNRLIDSVGRFFGGEGTPEMNAYRAEQEKYDAELAQINQMSYGYKTIETKVRDLPDLKKGIENYSMIEKALESEKLGYEFGSPEYEKDWIVMDTFQSAVKELASEDADVMRLVIGMGANGSIKKLYDAYKENFWEEGKTVEDKQKAVQKMLKDTVTKTSSKEKEIGKVQVKAAEALENSNDVQKLPS